MIDLAECTQETLNALAATTVSKDPFSDLLKVPPSAPKDRLGRFTGQQHREKIKQKIQPAQPAHFNTLAVPVAKDMEKKREKKVVSVAAPAPAPPPPPTQTAGPVSAHQGGGESAQMTRDKMINTLHKYLSVGADVPWSLLGRKNPLVAAGIEIQVLPLWRVVQDLGGFGEVCNRKLWNAVRRELGIDTPAFHNVHKLRDTYAKFLLPYEVFLRHQREGRESIARRE